MASPYSRRNEKSIYIEISSKLKSCSLVDTFEVNILKKDHKFEVKLKLNEKVWEKRRRYDGFVLLLGHPDLPQNASEIVKLYRAKDAIEKDFQIIKSVVKLRPIYHYTDPKVRAHVTLCLLALLLERTLEHRFKSASQKMTASACFEILSTCHLNQLEPQKDLGPMYTVTRLTPEQKTILNTLNLNHLGSDKDIAELILPR